MNAGACQPVIKLKLLHVACRELIMEHTKRATNHAELLEALRQVNHMIQKAAKLRVGAPKARIVSACRAAVKENNTNALLKIIREGSESL